MNFIETYKVDHDICDNIVDIFWKYKNHHVVGKVGGGIHKKIKDSNLPEDIRIGAIVRKDQVIIPRSNFVFEKDDLVVFLAKREQLKEVESIFSVSSI